MTTPARIPAHKRPVAIVEVDGGYLRTGRAIPVEVAVARPGQPSLAWLVRLGTDPAADDGSAFQPGQDHVLKGYGLTCRVVALELQDVLKGRQILSGEPLRTRRFFEELHNEAGLRHSVKVGDLFAHLQCEEPSRISIDEASTVANDLVPRTERAAVEAGRNAIFMAELIARSPARDTDSRPSPVQETMDKDSAGVPRKPRMGA